MTSPFLGRFSTGSHGCVYSTSRAEAALGTAVTHQPASHCLWADPHSHQHQKTTWLVSGTWEMYSSFDTHILNKMRFVDAYTLLDKGHKSNPTQPWLQHSGIDQPSWEDNVWEPSWPQTRFPKYHDPKHYRSQGTCFFWTDRELNALCPLGFLVLKTHATQPRAFVVFGKSHPMLDANTVTAKL